MTDQVLSGVRIVDLTHSWAGPHGTRVLADFGAEVIRIEYVRRLCMLRGGRLDDQMYNKHPMWWQVNRGKLSITLDLQEPADRAIFSDLVASSDALVENARGGVSRLGLRYEELTEIKPDLIVLSMAAFGKTGPYAPYAGYGGTMESLGGIQTLTGYEGNAKPSRIKELDVTNGVLAACALMTALIYRQRTGRGQWIDLSQLETGIHGLIGEYLLESAMNGTYRERLGNRHPRFAPQGCYRCAGEDRWLTLVIRSEEEWRTLCDVLERPDWKTDSRFCNVVARRQNYEVLDRLIESWTSSRDHYEAMHLLQARGLAAGAVLDVADLAQDPHLAERAFFTPAADGKGGLYPGLPIRLSKGTGRIRSRGPELGEHNEFVVCEVLKRPKEDVRAIREDEIGTAFDVD